jgi:hypothetical protein
MFENLANYQKSLCLIITHVKDDGITPADYRAIFRQELLGSPDLTKEARAFLTKVTNDIEIILMRAPRV